MRIFPAIDLKNGQCVRLRQGAFDDATVYESDPVLQAQIFAEAGATDLHLVDLDGARDGAARQTKIVEQIIQSTALSVQVGGGIRTRDDIERLLGCGARRVVVGSLAVQKPETVRDWMAQVGGERIVLALDVRLNEAQEPMVLTRGWQDESSQTLWDVLRTYEKSGAKTLLCTDVARDGMLAGPSLDLYARLRAAFPSYDLLASGGIGSLADLRALAALGAQGAITGKALYENRFSLADAVKEARDAR